MGDTRRAAGDAKSIERVDPLKPVDGGPIVTAGNVDDIASVLADPAQAWRREPATRKVAAANLRGLDITDDASDELIDGQLEQLMGGLDPPAR